MVVSCVNFWKLHNHQHLFSPSSPNICLYVYVLCQGHMIAMKHDGRLYRL